MKTENDKDNFKESPSRWFRLGKKVSYMGTCIFVIVFLLLFLWSGYTAHRNKVVEEQMPNQLEKIIKQETN